jgi:hypothetical protein
MRGAAGAGVGSQAWDKEGLQYFIITYIEYSINTIMTIKERRIQKITI